MAILDSINKYAVAGQANEEAYKDVRTVGEQCYNDPTVDRETEFLAQCWQGENEFMEINYHHDPDAKHIKGKRKGQWKYRTYLPRAYATAKSAVKKALDVGVNPAGLGKSALEKATKALTHREKTDAEKATEGWTKFMKHVVELDVADRQIWATTGRMALDTIV